MPHAIWTGYLGFGLVNVPVALYGATEDRSIRFHQLHRGTSHRVRYRKVDEATGDELAGEDIVRAFPMGGGGYVVLEDDDFERLAPGRSQEIAISDFVDLADVDPTYFQKSYYLGPRTPESAKAYGLLREAMRRQGKVGIATLVMRDKEYLVAVRPSGEVLALETLFFADEVRSANAVLPPSGTTAGGHEPRELEIAEQLVASLSGTWDPTRYRDTYRERLLALIEAKREGAEYVVEEAPPQANVVDLVAALEASVAKAQAARRRPGRHGAERLVPSAGGEAATTGEQQAFEGMSRAELLAIAAERAVQGRTRMTKLELVEALREGREAPLAHRRARRTAS